MASSNLMQMQAAYNRIARVADLAVINVDGGMGSATAQAAANGLAWVVSGKCANNGNCVPEVLGPPANELLLAIMSDTGQIDQTRLMQVNTMITQNFNMAADAVGAPVVPPMVTPSLPSVPSSSPIKFPSSISTATSGVGASLKDLYAKFRLLPTWQQALIAAAAIGGTLYVGKQVSKRKPARVAS
jgi:hypothetical protein